MITITPAATLAIKDSSLSQHPNPVPFAGTGVICPTGALAQDVILPAATVAATIPFPLGVTTAKVLAIFPATATDLVVTYKGDAHAVPLQQPFFLYDAAAADLSISTALGGKVSIVVGG